MLSEVKVVEEIRVQPDGEIIVFESTRVMRGELEVARTPAEGRVLMPGDSADGETERVSAITAAVHTPEVVKAYAEARERAGAELRADRWRRGIPTPEDRELAAKGVEVVESAPRV